MDEDTDLISGAQAAAILGVSRQAVHDRVKAGSLVPVRVDYRGSQRQPKYRRSDVERLKRDQTETETK